MATKIDPSSIIIERIIVHDIPKHKKGDLSEEPNYSQQESKLSDGLRKFFKDKVVQSLSSDKALKVCYDNNNTSPISWLSNEVLKADGSNIILHSRTIGKHLFEIQVGSNAAGILVMIYGKVNSLGACIILKLERDQGAQLTLDPKTNSYNIDEVRDLMLTQKTKIFKVALLFDRVHLKTKYDGVVTDHQIDLKVKKEVLTWFIKDFLGCRPFEDPKITTQNFYNYTIAYIQTLEEPLDKAKYIQDLNSYIQKNSATLSPKEYADDYLNTTEHRNNYRNYLETKKFKFSSFPKDTTQIDRQVKKFVMLFENDIAIIGNKGTFDNKVKLEKLESGLHRAVITGKIKSVK